MQRVDETAEPDVVDVAEYVVRAVARASSASAGRSLRCPAAIAARSSCAGCSGAVSRREWSAGQSIRTLLLPGPASTGMTMINSSSFRRSGPGRMLLISLSANALCRVTICSNSRRGVPHATRSPVRCFSSTRRRSCPEPGFARLDQLDDACGSMADWAGAARSSAPEELHPPAPGFVRGGGCRSAPAPVPAAEMVDQLLRSTCNSSTCSQLARRLYRTRRSWMLGQ